MRNSARKNLRNRSTKSRLKTLERKYLDLLGAGNKDEAAKTLRSVNSALDKAVKTGVIHRASANRKKSRLTVRLNALMKPPASASAPQPAAEPNQ